jgi:membrane dipeptidase
MTTKEGNMAQATQKVSSSTLRNHSYLIVDGLSMPTPERRWFEEWRAGGIACVNTTIALWETAGETLALLGKWRTVVAQNSDLIATATSVNEIKEIAASDRTAIVFSFQNTAPIEHNIELFGAFRDHGVCVMQLTYNLQNFIDTGISSLFGRTAIKEMNNVGILIDLSHCGERTTLDAIEMSGRPVAITHANPRDFVGSPVYGARRLKTTEAIKALAVRKGVIGLTPNRNMTKNGAATTLEEFGEMIAWLVDLVGIDTVGIGSDYCPGHSRSIRTWWRYARWSRESAPAEQMQIAPHEGWSDWFRSPASIQNIASELNRRGFSDEEISKIMGGNWLRVFGESFTPSI